MFDRIADLDLRDALLDAFEEGVVDGVFDDSARAGGAFLAVESEGRSHDPFDGSIDVRIRADDDRVLAAHLEDGALDPDLALLRFRGALVNFEADGFRAGEGDEACLRVFDQRAPHGRAALAQVHDAGRHAGLFEYIEEARGDGGCVGGGLKDDGVAAHDGRGGHAGHDGEGKIPRRDDRADAERHVEELVALAGILDRRRGIGETQSFAGVELEEVDGLCDIGIGFCPVLSDLVSEPGAELELAITNDGRGAQQQ